MRTEITLLILILLASLGTFGIWFSGIEIDGHNVADEFEPKEDSLQLEQAYLYVFVTTEIPAGRRLRSEDLVMRALTAEEVPQGVEDSVDLEGMLAMMGRTTRHKLESGRVLSEASLYPPNMVPKEFSEMNNVVDARIETWRPYIDELMKYPYDPAPSVRFTYLAKSPLPTGHVVVPADLQCISIDKLDETPRNLPIWPSHIIGRTLRRPIPAKQYMLMADFYPFGLESEEGKTSHVLQKAFEEMQQLEKDSERN
jgi:hypothetical protein